MESYRLPRFARAASLVPLQLTERDREIIRLVHQHRFLSSAHICALVGGSRQRLLRRLNLLYHHRFLERPRAQLEYYHRGGSRPMVYGLGTKGTQLLKQGDGDESLDRRWGEMNRSAGRMFLRHALLVSDTMVAIELACRRQNVRLMIERDLAVRFTGKNRRFRWRVTLHEKARLGIVPDRTFALEYPDADGETHRAVFFLEADRGTMPVIRANLSQTSFYRKLRAYEATWSSSLHRTRFGFHRFRVLTVTESPGRVASLVAACAKLQRGHRLFLFADRSVLEQPLDLFAPLWRSGKDGESVSLLP